MQKKDVIKVQSPGFVVLCLYLFNLFDHAISEPDTRRQDFRVMLPRLEINKI